MRRSLLLIALLAAGCKPSRPARAAAPATGEERLIAADVGKRGDPELGARYADLDAAHFGGKLPEVPVLWEPGLDALKLADAPALTIEGLWGRSGERAAILLNPRLAADPKNLTATLCHEMIHEYLDTVGRSAARHGPEFQAQLKRLHDEGAFEGLAPSEGEKEGLKTWLAEQRARLDDVQKDLAARRAALGDSPSREALADYNGLVQRQNVMAGDYNREAERYNRMLVYPDGLDEERVLASRADAAGSAR